MEEEFDYSPFIQEIEKERENPIESKTPEAQPVDYKEFTTAITKERAEKAGINFDDDAEANPLLKRRTAEEMDVSDYTNGVYLVKICINEITFTKPLIKEK